MATCNPIPDFLRLSYFYGQMLGHHELATEQSYHRDKHELHNRALHGHGVVCGLLVASPPAPLPVETSIVVECGLALDPAGHDVVVRTPITVDLFKALSAADQARLDAVNGTTLWVSACYQELKINPTRPVLPDACGSAPDCMYGMVREAVCIVVTVDPPVADTRCDCCAEALSDKADPCVLLARIDGFKRGQLLAATAIHNEVRRAVGRWVSTKIDKVTWTHAGTHPVSVLDNVELTLSAAIDPATVVPGVVDVIRTRANGEMAYVAGAVSATATTVVWKRDPGGANLKPDDRIQIVLHGDFVLDLCGRPVDAAHVGGHLPSGNASGGGDFLSWFTIAP